MPIESLPSSQTKFDLVRWFSISAFVAISGLSIAIGTFFTHLLTTHALKHDAEVMSEFVNTIIREDAAPDVATPVATIGGTDKIEAFFTQLGHVPGILRANVYSREQTVLWSTEASLVNQRFAVNDELREALEGDAVSHLSKSHEHSKEEHTALSSEGQRFVEYYLPIWQSERDKRHVIAVAELYRVPYQLLASLDRIAVSVWISALCSGLFLFACLFWIVRRGANIIAAQDAQLLNTQRLVTIGEMAATVAHSLRNPLSSIRSSAELARDNGNSDDTNHALDQIMLEADMMESWVRRYLGLMGDQAKTTETCSLRLILDEAILSLSRHPQSRAIAFERNEPPDEVTVQFNPVVLLQIVSGLLCNAVEANPADGKVQINVSREGAPAQVRLQVCDRGSGIKPEDLKRVFEPFFTTKRNGLGIGLALTHQILQRNGGRIDIKSDQQHGTIVTVHFAAEPA